VSEAVAFDLESGLVGIHEGMANADYHAAPGLSFSGAKEFLTSPAHYQAYLAREKAATKSQTLGTLVHRRILEPKLYAGTVVKVDGPMNTNPWKQQAAEAKSLGQDVVNKVDWDKIEGMHRSVMEDVDAASVIRAGKTEVSCFVKDPEFGVLIKCRPDVLVLEAGIIADLKTFDDARESAFTRQVMRMGYHIQTAWYLHVLSLLTGTTWKNFLHIVVETEAPHSTGVFCLNDASIERAMLDVKTALKRYAECMESNMWPGLPGGIKEIAIPDWAFAWNGGGEYEC
jgi:hypothetical protein